MKRVYKCSHNRYAIKCPKAWTNVYIFRRIHINNKKISVAELKDYAVKMCGEREMIIIPLVVC